MQGVETLAPIAAAANSAPRPPEQEIGAGVASGEMPHAQACILYLLRIGVIEQLSEAGQRAMLEKCAASSQLSALPRMKTLQTIGQSPRPSVPTMPVSDARGLHALTCHSMIAEISCVHSMHRLAAVVSSVLGNQVPVTVTALEAMARLLGVLEEVNHDTRLVVYEPVMLKLTSACAAVRHQARLSAIATLNADSLASRVTGSAAG